MINGEPPAVNARSAFPVTPFGAAVAQECKPFGEEDMTEIAEKHDRLREILEGYASLAIAFSGGVDSAFLLKAAVDTLGAGRVASITARSANFAEWEHREAVAFARECGSRHVILDWDFLAVPEAAANVPERCYHCKRDLFSGALKIAREHGFEHLADGTNADDVGDYRPGSRAARELGVVSPLREARLGKADIRALLREMGVPLWSKPSFACLASRFPYGTRITAADLRRVEKAESHLLERGFRNVRVRHHGELARIELEPAERARLLGGELCAEIDAALRDLGYAYIAVDLRGYRTGSMNEVLPAAL